VSARILVAIFGAALLMSCAGGTGGEPGSRRPMILDARAPWPVLHGSFIEVRGAEFDRLGEDVLLFVGARGESPTALARVPLDDESRWVFEVSRALIGDLGPGRHDVDLVIGGTRTSSPRYVLEIQVAYELDIALDGIISGDVFRNDVIVLTGAGFLSANEGTVEARFEGDYTYEDGSRISIDARLPVTLAEEFSRDRGVLVLSTALGGVKSGEFLGEVSLESRTLTGGRSSSERWRSRLQFQPPTVYGIEPALGSLEQLLDLRGAGFVGGDTARDEVTLVRLEGMFSPTGSRARRFGPEELVLGYRSGQSLEFRLESEERGGRLISTLFGETSGRFEGQVTPLTLKGTTEVVGSTRSLVFELVPLQQVVYVRFVPSFYETLSRFGLSAAADAIAALVEVRIEEIYRFWSVDVRLQRPEDFSPSGYSTIEIGGTDPNGVGLFGYDNTPGKDVGNLRLFDAIGGANSATQDDGYPGYGGVFVESFLYWSTHPELPGSAPTSAPDPDPLFDLVFDPVRASAATLAEVRGEGSPERSAVVIRAINALSGMIGETAAHELGHSFGLADPYGSSRVFHNDDDGDGCLMDSGSNRPLGERMGLADYAETRLCHDAPTYMDEILPP